MLNRRRIIIVASLLVLLLVSIGIASTSNSPKKNQTPTSDFIASDAPATLTNSEELYTLLGAVRFDLLRSDLTKYARDYKKSVDKNIAYSISNVKLANDTTVTFNASYTGSSSYKVTVTVEKLNNERAKISITDTATKDNSFNASLSANDKRNNYIATLPITTDAYIIDFDATSNVFVVSLSERSAEARDAAEAAILNAVGIEEKDKITYLVPGTGDTF